MSRTAFLPLTLLALASGCATVDTADESSERDALHGSVPVYFNHTYGIISPATTDAMATNTYLNETFVDVELRTTVRPDITYTGTYLNTRETYLEFFPDGTFGFPIGVTGLALGDEKPGGLQTVYDRWVGAFGEDGVDPIALVSREVNGVTVPWFDSTAPFWGYSSEYTGVWCMEYVPNPSSTKPRTRHEERAARYDATKLARNVQAVVYGLPDGDRANMRTTLASVGWSIVGTPDGGFVAVTPKDQQGSRVIYIARPAAPGRIGLLGVVWRLNRFASHVETIGDATLTVGLFGKNYASLWFVPRAADELATETSLAAD